MVIVVDESVADGKESTHDHEVRLRRMAARISLMECGINKHKWAKIDIMRKPGAVTNIVSDTAKRGMLMYLHTLLDRFATEENNNVEVWCRANDGTSNTANNNDALVGFGITPVNQLSEFIHENIFASERLLAANTMAWEWRKITSTEMCWFSTVDRRVDIPSAIFVCYSIGMFCKWLIEYRKVATSTQWAIVQNSAVMVSSTGRRDISDWSFVESSAAQLDQKLLVANSVVEQLRVISAAQVIETKLFNIMEKMATTGRPINGITERMESAQADVDNSCDGMATILYNSTSGRESSVAYRVSCARYVDARETGCTDDMVEANTVRDKTRNNMMAVAIAISKRSRSLHEYIDMFEL